MKRIISVFLIIASLFFIVPVISTQAYAVTRVKGYIKNSGTYVAPHFKSTPNKSKFDNFSTKGNINPFTGKKGTVNPFKITPKKYR